jgi:hypothetical protein
MGVITVMKLTSETALFATALLPQPDHAPLSSFAFALGAVNSSSLSCPSTDPYSNILWTISTLILKIPKKKPTNTSKSYFAAPSLLEGVFFFPLFSGERSLPRLYWSVLPTKVSVSSAWILFLHKGRRETYSSYLWLRTAYCTRQALWVLFPVREGATLFAV